MSYTLNYNGTVNASGSVRVSYPPSEHGGTTTAYYNDTIPVTFSVTVDTTPFDSSVAGASNRIDGLTASVAAMNTANCAVIIDNSKRISETITDGFYGLIQNDISTKITETKTALQTKHALLMEHSKAVVEKHTRMQRDVEREQANYGKIIRELDKELQNRIAEINKPAFKLSRNIKEETINAPYLKSAAETADLLSAGQNSGSKVAAAGLRQKVSNVLRDLSNSLSSNLRYRHMMRNILWDKSISNEQQSYIPVAYCFYDDVTRFRKVYQCYAPQGPEKDSVLAGANAYVSGNMNAAPRDIPPEEMNLIEQAFSNMVQESFSGLSERSEYQERVYTEIFKLWKNSSKGFKQL